MYAPTKIANGEAPATNGLPPAKKLAIYEYDDENPNNLSRRAVDNLRPIKVIVLGTGMSGIIAGIFFPRQIENLELTIYDKNADLGGTWYESRLVLLEGFFKERAMLSFDSRYPGIACDVPAHAYQYTFESNTQWSSFWPGGAEIHSYLKSVATKYDATRYMKFKKQCDQAVWDEVTGKWTLHMTDLNTGMVR